MLCPACACAPCEVRCRHTVEAAAEHFVPRERDPERHTELVEHLSSVLWKQDHVDVRECLSCGFGFSDPWVGGDPRFYALAHEGDPHYPGDRWEFGETLEALAGFEQDRERRLAEVGAGDGAFLDALGPGFVVRAADFDAGAVQRLKGKGYAASLGSLDVLVGPDEPFDVVCMFQTLEHVAPLEDLTRTLCEALRPGGDLFVSVPNHDGTRFQESVTGLWDMPPNHVGRWTPLALQRAFESRGFETVAIRMQPVSTRAIAWQLAVSAVNARSYRHGTIEGRVNAVRSRALRGGLKRVLAIFRLPALLLKRRGFRPLAIWAHFRFVG